MIQPRQQVYLREKPLRVGTAERINGDSVVVRWRNGEVEAFDGGDLEAVYQEPVARDAPGVLGFTEDGNVVVDRAVYLQLLAERGDLRIVTILVTPVAVGEWKWSARVQGLAQITAVGMHREQALAHCLKRIRTRVEYDVIRIVEEK